MGIIVGTALLWALNALLVVPLTRVSVARAIAAEGVVSGQREAVPPEVAATWQKVAVRHYIMWDVLVLGLAGFVGGLMGYYFIGVSLEAKGWPGMLAFIAASFAGLAAGGRAG
jgi:hypothetical protein